MDIILNTNFRNASLPRIPTPGIYDDFERPDSQGLGVSADGKTWEYTGSGIWQIVDGKASSEGAAISVAYLDGLVSDGVLTTLVARAGTADNDYRSGLAFRVIDFDNLWHVTPNTSGMLTLYGRQTVGDTIIVNSSSELHDGDELSVELQGPSITVRLNGSTIIEHEHPMNMHETKHGFMSFNRTTIAEFEYIELVV